MLLKKRKGCYSCPIHCKRGIALDDPKYGVDSRYGGPEYETMAVFGFAPRGPMTLETLVECIRAVKLFHDISGCDPETGRPRRGKLMEMDLEWVEEMLTSA